MERTGTRITISHGFPSAQRFLDSVLRNLKMWAGGIGAGLTGAAEVADIEVAGVPLAAVGAGLTMFAVWRFPNVERADRPVSNRSVVAG